MTRDLDAVLASIDGALADEEFPDAMRWSPEPETVDAPAPYDGEVVWQPPQRYESDREHVGRLIASLVVPPEPELRAHGLVEVVFASTPEQLLARQRVIDREAADRARARADLQRYRRPAPRPGRGLVPDLVLFDDVFLVDPAHRDEVRARRQEESQRALAQLGETWSALVGLVRDVAEGIAPTLEAIGKALTGLRPQLPAPPATLRETDPRAYALQLRQTRGTGPDRQLQRQHRPRRHP